VNWTDNKGLSGYIFSLCNGTPTCSETVMLQNNTTESLEDVYTRHYLAILTQYDHRASIKFNISSIPEGARIDDASLCLNIQHVANEWEGSVTYYRIDNQTWTERDAINDTDSLTLTNATTKTGYATSIGWHCLNVTDQFYVDYNAGNSNTSFRINDTGDGKRAQNNKTNDLNLYIGKRYKWAVPVEYYYIVAHSRLANVAANKPYLNVTYTYFVNDTWTNDGGAFTGTTAWSNATKVINETVGATIKWRVYANDTDNLWNGTSIFSFVTTSGAINYPQWIYMTNGTNSTLAGQPIEFGLNWSDVEGLSGFKLSLLNGTNDIDRTCSDIFGDCLGVGETNDSIITDCIGISNGVDIDDIELNATIVKTNDPINVTCVQMDQPGPMGTIRQYVYYHNGIVWLKLANWTIFGNTTPPTPVNRSVTFISNATIGMHVIRCINTWSLDGGSIDDACADTETLLYDNDDVNFTVIDWHNETWTEMTGTANQTNYTDASSTYTITDTEGVLIQWGFYANNTGNYWNVSDTFSFITTGTTSTTTTSTSSCEAGCLQSVMVLPILFNIRRYK